MATRINAYKHQKVNIGNSWDLSLQAFINDRKVNNLAQRTIEWYEEILGDYLLPFVSSLKVNSPIEFTKEHLDAYIIYLRETRLNQPSTINTKLVALEPSCIFSMRMVMFNKDKGEEKLKTDTKILKLFTEEDIQKIIERPNLEKCMTYFYDLSTLIVLSMI